MKESDPLFQNIYSLLKSRALTYKIIHLVKKNRLSSYGKAKRKNTRRLKLNTVNPTETKKVKKPSFFKTLFS
jgi:hypothetical protein